MDISSVLNTIIHGNYLDITKQLPNDKVSCLILSELECSLAGLGSIYDFLPNNSVIFYHSSTWIDSYFVNQRIIQRYSGKVTYPNLFLKTYTYLNMIHKDDFKLRYESQNFTDVWDVDIETMYLRCIYASNGELIIGNSDVAIAAKKLQRDFIGIEQSIEVIETANQRLQNVEIDVPKEQMRMF